METNVLVLAYIGDAIYELYVRKYLINKNIVKVKELQSNAILYVSAKRQALFLKKLLEEDFFKEDEIDIIKRARNHKSRMSKNTDIVTYKHATGLEALIGYLYYQNKNNRIEEIMQKIFNMEGV